MTQLSNLCHCSEALLVCSDNWGFKPARYIACMTKVIGPRGMVNGPTVVARMARCFKCVYSFEFLFATSFWPAQYMLSVFSIVLCSYVHGFWARIHVWFHARSFASTVYNCCDRGHHTVRRNHCASKVISAWGQGWPFPLFCMGTTTHSQPEDSVLPRAT